MARPFSRSPLAFAVGIALRRRYERERAALEVLHAMNSLQAPEPAVGDALRHAATIREGDIAAQAASHALRTERAVSRNYALGERDTLAYPYVKKGSVERILVGGQTLEVTTGPLPPGVEVQGKMFVNGEEVTILKR